MRFLTLSPLAALALLIVVLALVVAAYLLKPGRRRVQVPSFLLWARVLGRQDRLLSRWRWWLSLLLACTIAGALALALARPEVAGVGGRSQRLVLLLDNSPSMATRTRDGGTRWQHAVSEARTLVAQLGGASEVMVLDSMGRAPVAGYVSPAQAWRDIAQLPLLSAGRPALPHLPDARAAQRTHWFTDGVALPAAPAGTRVHGVFEPADNVGITVFEARPHPADVTRVRALLQLTNGSARALKAQVTISGPDFTLARELTLQAGESRGESLDLSSGGAGVYRASVQAPGDALAVDNEAFAVVPAHQPRRVLLVTSGTPRLADSLRALPGVALSTARTAQGAAGSFDVYVFDRAAPATLPPAGVLLFGSVAAAARPVTDAVVSAWDSLHPLARGVAWEDLRVQTASLAQREVGGSTAVVSAAGLKGNLQGTLVSAGEDRARWIRVGFELGDSNFTLQPGFPVFLANAIDWLAPRPAPLTRHLGEIVVPLAAAEVRDARGVTVSTLDLPTGTRFEAPRPGLYSARAHGADLQVVANVADPAYSLVNASWLPPRAPGAGVAAATAYVARAEFWTLLLLIAAVLVLVEWASFTRKVSV